MNIALPLLPKSDYVNNKPLPNSFFCISDLFGSKFDDDAHMSQG